MRIAQPASILHLCMHTHTHTRARADVLILMPVHTYTYTYTYRVASSFSNLTDTNLRKPQLPF